MHRTYIIVGISSDTHPPTIQSIDKMVRSLVDTITFIIHYVILYSVMISEAELDNDTPTQIIDLEECTKLATEWDEENNVEYGLYTALDSISHSNPIVVKTETKKYIENGEMAESTSITDVGVIKLSYPEIPRRVTEYIEENYDLQDLSSYIQNDPTNLVEGIHTVSQEAFAENGFNSNIVHPNTPSTVKFNISNEEAVQFMWPEMDTMTGISLFKYIEESHTEYPFTWDGQRIELTVEIEIDSNPEDYLNKEILLEAIDDVHNGTLNKSPTAALTFAIYNNTDLSQAEIARNVGVQPSVISTQISSVYEELHRAEHSAVKYTSDMKEEITQNLPNSK